MTLRDATATISRFHIKAAISTVPPGGAMLTVDEGAGFRVVWFGPLKDLPDFQAGQTLWVHRSDYDRIISETA